MDLRVTARSASILGVMLPAVCFGRPILEYVPESLRDEPISSFTHSYATPRGLEPLSVISADNNVDLVFACREPRSLAELRRIAGPALQRQLRLLQTRGLVHRNDEGRFETTVPILGPPESMELRRLAGHIAGMIATDPQVEWGPFNEHPADRDWNDNVFSLVYSLILNDLVFDAMAELGLIEKRSQNTASTTGNGTVWIVYPIRSHSFKTKSLRADGVTLSAIWNAAASRRLASLIEIDALGTLAAAVSSGDPVSAETRRTFAGYGLFDASGNCLVPRVSKIGDGDELYRRCARMAARIADIVGEQVPHANLRGLIYPASASDRVVVLYHEIMWELLAKLDRAGTVATPGILNGGLDRTQAVRLLLVVERESGPEGPTVLRRKAKAEGRVGRVLEVLNVYEGQVVADIGCGSGWLSEAIAKALGPDGRVYAVEIDRSSIRRVKERGISNVVPVLSKPDDASLPNGVVDAAFLHDVANHVDRNARPKLYASIARALKPDGCLVLIDPHGGALRLLEELGSFGFHTEEDFDGLSGKQLDTKLVSGIRFRFRPDRTGSAEECELATDAGHEPGRRP